MVEEMIRAERGEHGSEIQHDIYDAVMVPENLVHITKDLEDAQSAHLIMSQLSLKELGGYENVQRILDLSVQTPSFIVLFTDKELEAFDQGSESIVEKTDAKAEYLHAQFGPVIQFIDPDLREDFWLNLLDHNSSEMKYSSDIKVVSIKIDHELDHDPLFEGNKKQRLDFILGHELDHVDNANSDTKRYMSELASDNTGLCAVEQEEGGKSPSKDDVQTSLVAKRMRNEFSGHIFNVAKGAFFEGVHEYSTAPFIEACAPANISEEARSSYLSMYGNMTEIINQKTPEWLSDYDFLGRPSEIIYKTHDTQNSFFKFNALAHILIGMGVEAREARAQNREFKSLSDYDISAKAQYISALREKHGDAFDKALDEYVHRNIYRDLKPAIEQLEDSLQTDAWLTEMTFIDRIEDGSERRHAEADFVERLKTENKDFVRPLFARELVEYAMHDIYDNKPEQWDAIVGELALKTYQSGIEDDQVKSALETYLNHNKILNNQTTAPEPTTKLGAVH